MSKEAVAVLDVLARYQVQVSVLFDLHEMAEDVAKAVLAVRDKESEVAS